MLGLVVHYDLTGPLVVLGREYGQARDPMPPSTHHTWIMLQPSPYYTGGSHRQIEWWDVEEPDGGTRTLPRWPVVRTGMMKMTCPRLLPLQAHCRWASSPVKRTKRGGCGTSDATEGFLRAPSRQTDSKRDASTSGLADLYHGTDSEAPASTRFCRQQQKGPRDVDDPALR